MDSSSQLSILKALLNKRDEIIKEVQEILGYSTEETQKLLILNRFDKDQSIQKALEWGERQDKEPNYKYDPDKEFNLWLVWFSEYKRDDVTIAPCGHFLWNICFYGFLSSAVKDGPQSIRTVCPISKCGDIISPEMFKNVINPDQYKIYDKYYTNYFVDCCKAIKWCPAPGWTKAVYHPELNAIDVFCEWGKGFCFYCGQEAHVPVECYYLQMFMEKLKEGEEEGITSSSDLWIKVNSKICPKCKSPIEKNQGCMHMTWYNWKYEFCWLCMGDYRNHQAETGIYLCNTFSDVQKLNRAKEGEMKERSRLDLKLRKFIHYATRYKEHLKSVDLDKKRGEQLRSQVQFIISRSGNKYTMAEFDFLDEIIELVWKARRALANSYSMRFFMMGRRKKAFFDFIQGDLEFSLEALSRCLVKDITEYIEMDATKTISLKEEFFKFKSNACQTRAAVETHFTKVLGQIKGDFPDVKEDSKGDEIDSSDEESGPTTKAKVQWTCYICTTRNEKDKDNWVICSAPRFVLKGDAK